MSSFFSHVPEAPREDLLADYLQFLETRNGTLSIAEDFPHRERWLAQANTAVVRHQGKVDQQLFEASWSRFDRRAAEHPALVALLAFVKMNAGEAYGVEVVSRTRHKKPEANAVFDRVERVLGKEETYHTRILLGATHQFEVPEPAGRWTPPFAVQALIAGLAHAPKGLFHPILLGAEVGGVFVFNWMLNRIGTLFRDEPELRESLEARMMEILIDEIGHVAFNRLAVGPAGLSAARQLAPAVAHYGAGIHPEFQVLGWSKPTLADFDRFDLSSLPEEARRRAFFA